MNTNSYALAEELVSICRPVLRVLRWHGIKALLEQIWGLSRACKDVWEKIAKADNGKHACLSDRVLKSAQDLPAMGTFFV